MVVREATLSALRLVALEAGFVDLQPRGKLSAGFRCEPPDGWSCAGTSGVKTKTRQFGALGRLAVDLVAVDASHMVRGVRSALPVAHGFTLRMATEADAVRLLRAARTKADDLAGVSLRRVQAGGA